MIVLWFLILLTVIVFVHELGHYLVARINGVRVEVFSGLCLLTLHFSAIGSLLGVAVMVGALIAHATELGFDLKYNSMLFVVLVTCALVFWVRRGHLPIIGRTLK